MLQDVNVVSRADRRQGSRIVVEETRRDAVGITTA